MKTQPNTLTVDDTIATLTDIAETDPVAMGKLLEARVTCNDALADHPTVQVGQRNPDNDDYTVGILGILNGLFGCDEDQWGYIAAIVDENGRCTGFGRADKLRKQSKSDA